MPVILAATWQPRGEMTRFDRLCPQLEQAYDQIVIALPANVAPTDLATCCGAAYDADPKHWARRAQIALEIIQAGLRATPSELGHSSFE